MSSYQPVYIRLLGSTFQVLPVPHTFFGQVTAKAIEKNPLTGEADHECLQLLAIRFNNLWNWKFTLQMNLIFQINTRELFRPFGYSSVVSSTARYVLVHAFCGVRGRLQF